MKRILVCECCFSEIGLFEDTEVFLPLEPDMFEPREHGFPPPFQPDADWLSMFCPVCSSRAVGWDEHSPDLGRENRILAKVPGGNPEYFIVPEADDETEDVAVLPVVAAPAVKRAYKKGKKRGR